MARFTRKQYQAAAIKLLPRGPAWNRNPKSATGQLMDAIALEQTNIDADIDVLEKNMNPATAEELMPEYEDMYGLPDDCASSDQTMQERRQALMSKVRKKDIPTVGWLKSFAKRLGYDIDITTHRPFICGLNRCGDMLGLGADPINGVISVEITGNHIIQFICGVSRCGDYLGFIRPATDLECHFNKIIPADILAIYNYHQDNTI
jgi:uncharacterized protein YmfQ (DUF2313 family)